MDMIALVKVKHVEVFSGSVKYVKIISKYNVKTITNSVTDVKMFNGIA